MEKHEKEVKNSDDPTALADDIKEANSNSNSNSTSDYRDILFLNVLSQCVSSDNLFEWLYIHSVDKDT